jgi:hypothetical protein
MNAHSKLEHLSLANIFILAACLGVRLESARQGDNIIKLNSAIVY